MQAGVAAGKRGWDRSCEECWSKHELMEGAMRDELSKSMIAAEVAGARLSGDAGRAPVSVADWLAVERLTFWAQNAVFTSSRGRATPARANRVSTVQTRAET
jgi:hypothetical protein